MLCEDMCVHMSKQKISLLSTMRDVVNYKCVERVENNKGVSVWTFILNTSASKDEYNKEKC